MLNPITYTEKVVNDFLSYQLTTYAFTDAALHAQMRALLNLEQTRATPLMNGPYIALSRSFLPGASIEQLAARGLLHPHLKQLSEYKHVRKHQEDAIQAISTGRTTVVSTGTGSGKTESFLYPIISRCLTLRDEQAPAGIVAVLVYPMNALAEDQLDRLRELLAGTGVPFGMYVGKTPEEASSVTGARLKAGASQADYRAKLAELRAQRDPRAVHPFEERVSRQEMRTPGQQPRILLTNVKQLELLLTRQRDTVLFDGARLEFIVFDEAHTFSGALGAESACLIRRLRAYCGRGPQETVCIATSATITDPEQGAEAARQFASRLFGVPADKVALVLEQYERDRWAPLEKRQVSGPLAGDPSVQLENVFHAVRILEEEPPSPTQLQEFLRIVQTLTGARLARDRWQERLYDWLAANEVVYQIAEALDKPRALSDLLPEVSRRIGREISEEEILIWLALGAIARREDRPLLRPVVHAFIRGVDGAVVTFPRQGPISPRLWLSAAEALEEGREQVFPLPVMTCTTCGQHYFTHHLKDFSYFDRRPEGGDATGDGVVWKPMAEGLGGARVVLVDRLITDEDEAGASGAAAHRLTTEVFFCRHCGALHPRPLDRCGGCGLPGPLIPLFAVQQKEDMPGMLNTCLACQVPGRKGPTGYWEPARPVRAVTVSDVHVLAQNMLQHAERRRLLVFTDNRQDAAFQAGWMHDHARRYRLRALMYGRIREGSLSVGDLTAWLIDFLEKDDDLSRMLIPEVWRDRKEAEGDRHREERKSFLRIQVLRELTMSFRRNAGLEPWGRLAVQYAGLTLDLPFIRTWAHTLGCSVEALRDGVALMVDIIRRDGALYDREGRVFSKLWTEAHKEIQRGYLPLMRGIPRGVKLRRNPGDDESRVQQWLSDRGETRARQIARRWGVPEKQLEEFLEGLWGLLGGELGLLTFVTLEDPRNRPLKHTEGVKQVDADRLRLGDPGRRGVFRCAICRRAVVRQTPGMVCPAWRCKGTLGFEEEDQEDYDLRVLDQQFVMIRPREHSAQVPSDIRERYERAFKGNLELVNTLVCTPTLELGVNIGALDAVLMRNVPPKPANYWQRAGRAGRQHRMAVNLTYARPRSHDRAYFAAPLKLLTGRIDPPSFNLKNELMIRKHVHAAVLTSLFRLGQPGGTLAEEARQALAATLARCFPAQIRDYLFDGLGHMRAAPMEVGDLTRMLHTHESALMTHVQEIFAQGWPEADRAAVVPEKLSAHVLSMGERLAEVIVRLDRRLKWATDQMQRLEGHRQVKGALDADEDAQYLRCKRLVLRLKGIQARTQRDAEGIDDTNTYSVLSAEGFLPGYGLELGAVVGTHIAPKHVSDLRDWELRRVLGLAVREYVPGNLIYAIGHRFYPRFYHLSEVEPLRFQADVQHSALVETGSARAGIGPGLNSLELAAIPICDVDLHHQSHISDDEIHRFQLPVTVLGYQQSRHSGGRAFSWGKREVRLLEGSHVRTVNIGPARLVRTGNLGYPVCMVCGQSRSALTSQKDLDEFRAAHLGRCGRQVQNIGFYADVVVDTLILQDCPDATEAYSVAEALRMGAAEVLDMELEDLQLLAIGRPGRPELDMLVYDPMPGGSGLLEQLVQRWDEVIEASLRVVEQCTSRCQSSCIDCLQNFRNAWYHPQLNRLIAADRLRAWGPELTFRHDISPAMPGTSGGEPPVNDAELTLRELLRRAGFSEPGGQRTISLPKPLGATRPDFFYDDGEGRSEGICIYLDGMSRHLHGDPRRAQKDQQIREELESLGYEVIVIRYGDLTDRAAMARHFQKLARKLMGREAAAALREDTSWFEAS